MQIGKGRNLASSLAGRKNGEGSSDLGGLIVHKADGKGEVTFFVRLNIAFTILASQAGNNFQLV